ncbi:MAG TPA: aspartate aminotransferase family protein [Bryobacteraceae bacterium]|nr:aspartate aminotransferase family protein [Bryobacteraceae bacterium]
MISNWDKSVEMLERSRRSLAGGVSSPFRAKAPVPLFFEYGHGSHLTDVDGNEYIDYQLAWGPMILGYSHPGMVDRLRRQVEKPLSYGAQHELEFTVAEKIQAMVPCAERVAFTSSGSEAVQLVHRLARAYTTRPLILKFEGHYHGWMDSALLSYKPQQADVGSLEKPKTVRGSRGQVPNSEENTVVAPWNRLEILEQILDAHPGQIAAIMMEAVLCNSGCLMPLPGYLQSVRELATKHGCLLIFDEVITGFRINPGGAQAHFNVTPDLATFGKAVGGGVPLSVVAGQADVMEQMYTSGVVFGGTFNGNPLSLAAADFCLDELSRNGGEALCKANRIGERLKSELPRLAHAAGLSLKTTGFGTVFALHFTKHTQFIDYRDTFPDDRELLSRFLRAALCEGVIVVPDGRFYVSTAHTEQDADQTLERLSHALQNCAGA